MSHTVYSFTYGNLKGTLKTEENHIDETKMKGEEKYLKQYIPVERCVYVTGSTMFYNPKSQLICRALGRCLGAERMMCLVTGGLYGAGEEVARSFLDERLRRGFKKNLWHVVPKKDRKDCSQLARQKPDRTFRSVPYGRTLFSGDSIKERETIVSRLFDICLLIEGGPRVVQEVEQFVKSDHLVLPVGCTGGAAGGSFLAPSKIFEVPPGVSAEDWAQLSSAAASLDQLGEVVVKIVQLLQQTTCGAGSEEEAEDGSSRAHCNERVFLEDC